MKKMLAVLVAGLGATPALASNLNVTVKSGGSSAVSVAPNATVNFTIEGLLSDNLNEGLALVGFDLHFTGGALGANTVVTPTQNPMLTFVKPQGITNPAGYVGTLIGGDLVQVGGGQNTIKNSVDNPACAQLCSVPGRHADSWRCPTCGGRNGRGRYGLAHCSCSTRRL